MRELLKTINDKIYDIKSSIKGEFINLRRALDYAKRGYRSHDWDYGYFISDMSWKLRRLGDCVKNNNFVEGADLTYQQTHEAAKYLDLLLENPEVNEAWDRICAEHPPLNDTFMSDRVNHVQFSEKVRALMDFEEAEYRKNLEKAFDIIKENHRNWWD